CGGVWVSVECDYGDGRGGRQPDKGPKQRGGHPAPPDWLPAEESRRTLTRRQVRPCAPCSIFLRGCGDDPLRLSGLTAVSGTIAGCPERGTSTWKRMTSSRGTPPSWTGAAARNSWSFLLGREHFPSC